MYIEIVPGSSDSICVYVNRIISTCPFYQFNRPLDFFYDRVKIFSTGPIGHKLISELFSCQTVNKVMITPRSLLIIKTEDSNWDEIVKTVQESLELYVEPIDTVFNFLTCYQVARLS